MFTLITIYCVKHLPYISHFSSLFEEQGYLRNLCIRRNLKLVSAKQHAYYLLFLLVRMSYFLSLQSPFSNLITFNLTSSFITFVSFLYTHFCQPIPILDYTFFFNLNSIFFNLLLFFKFYFIFIFFNFILFLNFT